LVLGFIACLGACSAKDNTDPYATVTEFCATWGRVACNSTVVQRCSGMTTVTSTLTDSCIASQQTFCEQLVPEQGYSSAQASTCLNAVKAAYEDANLTGAEVATVRDLGDPCNHLIKGPKGTGDTCLKDTDCDTVHNVLCVMKSGVGTCVIPTVVPNGTSCSAPEAACMNGFYCDGAHCVQSNAVGVKCAASYECAAGLVCDGAGDAGTETGKCTTLVDPSACMMDSDCTSGVCDKVGTATTGSCVDSITLARAEGVCGDLR
jgi:hypothetical protein